ncbi:3-hydroxyisobutyryl-CoA hydrolase 1-like protein [Tanacetum coccineum]
MDSVNQSNARSRDSGWKYATKGSIPGSTICRYSKEITHVGIYKAKQHLAGGYRNSKGCQLCPTHVREEMREYFWVLKQNKQNAKVLPDFDDVEEYAYDEDGEVGNGSQQGRRKFQAQPSKKQKGVKGPMDIFGIAIEAVTQHGTSFKPPSYHKVRVPYLAKAIKSTDEMVKQVHHEQWAKYGCSLMSNGWQDLVAHKYIIKSLVNSPRGSVFVRSIDASNMVEEIREQNVVQVVTDNASNYKAVDSKSKTNAKVGNDVKWLIYNRTGVVNMMRKFTRKRELLRPATT